VARAARGAGRIVYVQHTSARGRQDATRHARHPVAWSWIAHLFSFLRPAWRLRRVCAGGPRAGRRGGAGDLCCIRLAVAVGFLPRVRNRPWRRCPPPPLPPRGLRSARFSRISTIVGQSSLRQSFQGRPRKLLTLRRGISPQTEQPPRGARGRNRAGERATDVDTSRGTRIVLDPALAAVHALAAFTR